MHKLSALKQRLDRLQVVPRTVTIVALAVLVALAWAGVRPSNGVTDRVLPVPVADSAADWNDVDRHLTSDDAAWARRRVAWLTEDSPSSSTAKTTPTRRGASPMYAVPSGVIAIDFEAQDEAKVLANVADDLYPLTLGPLSRGAGFGHFGGSLGMPNTGSTIAAGEGGRLSALSVDGESWASVASSSLTEGELSDLSGGPLGEGAIAGDASAAGGLAANGVSSPDTPAGITNHGQSAFGNSSVGGTGVGEKGGDDSNSSEDEETDEEQSNPTVTVPEPETWSLLVLGALALLIVRRSQITT